MDFFSGFYGILEIVANHCVPYWSVIKATLKAK